MTLHTKSTILTSCHTLTVYSYPGTHQLIAASFSSHTNFWKIISDTSHKSTILTSCHTLTVYSYPGTHQLIAASFSSQTNFWKIISDTSHKVHHPDIAQCELEGFGWTWSSSGVSDCAFPISLNVFGIVAVVLDSLKPRHHGKVPYPRRGVYLHRPISGRLSVTLHTKSTILTSCHTLSVYSYPGTHQLIAASFSSQTNFWKIISDTSHKVHHPDIVPHPHCIFISRNTPVDRCQFFFTYQFLEDYQ